MTSVKTNTPNNNYGRVYLPILTNTKLKPKVRLVYALLAIRQGCTDEAHLTQKQIADSLSVSTNTIKRAFKKLKAEEIIEATVNGWKVKQPEIKNQYGNVELIVIGATFLSNRAKLLYAYYIVVTSGVDKCTRSAKTITKDLGVGEETYRKAFKELVENTLITVGKRNTGNGYVNVVVPRKLKKANPKDFLPASWFKEDEIQLDSTDVNPYDIGAMMIKKTKVSKQEYDSIISDGLVVTNKKVRESQCKGMNINQNTNHNIITNSEPDLTDRTSLSLPTEDKRRESLEEIPFDINPKIFALDFNMDELREREVTELEFNTVVKAFIGTRKALNKHEWRMSNRDFNRFEDIFNETGYREGVAEEYVEFIETYANHNPEQLSYYNSFEIKHRYFHHLGAGLVGTRKKREAKEIRDILTI
ncbi:helix-turn-helix domain-containing protein [uncultured Draconibacterium sp.]|uniref:helix-turn-helix domain-containing protein n=1 Tax=uncultured Draconibacterium sp. TaxID=1573823 RepID=UPI0032167C76